ncbi:cell wall-binding repeat-containing protein [Leifsonia sp. NPDC058292]|uniref:cell wall-binding repeat-containing protein n=1 Tax=Leifsonia sp. NPDC058292 TaxID=3346428 RepID=UPI0036DB7A2E
MGNTGERTGARKNFIGLIVTGLVVAGLLTPQVALADTSDQTAQRAQEYYAARTAAAQRDGLEHVDKSEATPKLTAQAQSVTATGSVDKSLFAAGNLMSDAVFFNGSAMTATDVQSFLNTQVGTCNPEHKPNVQPCLKSYTTASAARPSDEMCDGYAALGSETAAQIIAKVGASCGINQGVLIALLQKEQGLVTDDWPSATQYQFATGYACPDDPDVGCDPDTAGFFAQVYGAAWQFKRYGNPTGTDDYFTWYPVGRVSNIAYSSTPSLNCGTAPIAIWNKATAALYYYTPYTPNQAALDNFFGTGDKCSEYGNRNFWGSYTQWFGNPNAGTVPAVSREAGVDRYSTAVAASQSAYPSPGTGVAAAYIANGLGFADALAAAPAAGGGGAAAPGGGTEGRQGPLLLVQQNGIPAPTLAELKRVKPKTIYVAGGAGVVSDAVLAQLAKLAPKGAVRLSGIDRYATARAVALASFGTTASTAYIATGLDYPDALSAGAAAGAQGMPVLLVNGTQSAPDAATLQALADMHITTIKLVGGTGVVSAGIASGLVAAHFSVSRLSAIDRYGTSNAVNQDAFPTAPPKTYFATAFGFPDALAGAAAAGHLKSPLYVSRPACVSADAAVGALRSQSIALLGGPLVLGQDVGKLSVCR